MPRYTKRPTSEQMRAFAESRAFIESRDIKAGEFVSRTLASRTTWTWVQRICIAWQAAFLILALISWTHGLDTDSAIVMCLWGFGAFWFAEKSLTQIALSEQITRTIHAYDRGHRDGWHAAKRQEGES